MYKALTQILAIILILCAVFYIFDRNNRKIERNNAAALTGSINERDQQINQLYQKIGVLERDLAHASNRIAEVKQHYEVQLAELKPALADPPSSEVREAQSFQQYASGLTALIESPEMVQNVRSRIEENQVKAIYGMFIKNSLTTAEDAHIITELLVDRYFLDWRMRVELMNIHLSRRERIVILDRVEKDQKNIDAKIKTRLGNDLFRTYQELKKTGEAREFIHAFNSQLAMEKLPILSDIQSKRIISIMTKELDTFHDLPAYVEFKKTPPEQLTEKQVNSIIGLVTDTYTSIRKQCLKLLKQKQKIVLNSFLDHLLNQQVTSLEFTQKMITKKKS